MKEIKDTNKWKTCAMFMDWKTISFTGEFYQTLKKKPNTNPSQTFQDGVNVLYGDCCCFTIIYFYKIH